MSIFGKILVILWFLVRLLARVVIDIAFTFISLAVFPFMFLVGYDPEKFLQKYNNWLFSGEFKR